MKIIVPVIIVIFIGAAVVFGSAATVDIRGGTIQAGSTDIHVYADPEGCTVEVSDWGLNLTTGLVGSVCLDVDDECLGKEIRVYLTHEGSRIACGSACIDAGEICIPLDTPVAACVITDIEVFICEPET